MAFWISRAGMRRVAPGFVLVLALAASGAVPARAEHIDIGPDNLSYKTTITIKNGTDSPVTFNRASNTCVPDAPESITLAANTATRPTPPASTSRFSSSSRSARPSARWLPEASRDQRRGST